ncbi:MAG: flavodoxin family protein [Eubacterium sp.]|nr:flavodoxin family protein [Candidatus Colimonas fimequi]
MKKVLVLNGSPRPNGNTVAMIKEFVRGAEEGGNIVNVCDVARMNIHPCVGCLGGNAQNTSSPCCQKDDMDTVYKYYNECDVVVFATPLYFWNFNAQTKAVIDRLFATMEGESPDPSVPAYVYYLQHKEACLMMPAEEESDANFQLINHYWDGFCERMDYTNYGKLLIGNLMEVGDVKQKPEALEAAYKFGRTIK